MYPTHEELFEAFSHHRPEGKLELIEGRLIVGNTMVGSRLLLRQILQGWKADAAVTFAPIESWSEALRVGYGLSLSLKGNSDLLQVREGKSLWLRHKNERQGKGESIRIH